MKKYRNKEHVVDVSINVILVIAALVALYPIWYVLIASVSSPVAISEGKVLLKPVGFNVDAYKKLLATKKIWIGYRNSIIYTSAATAMDMAVQIPCAYALSRKSLPGRRIIMTLFLFTMFFSGGLIPKYLLLSSMGMVNNPIVMVVPGCINVFNIIVARSFFESSVPDALFDAARIEGCGYTKFFLKIVLPLSPAMLAVIALFCVQSHWNAYLTGQMYLYNPDLHTLQQVIKSITASLDSGLVEKLTAAEMVARVQEKQLLKYAVVVVSCLPLVIVYPFIQKFFVQGVMIGAVKE